MRGPPPEVVASWPRPNYVNPEYQGHQLAIVGILLLVLSTCVLCLRLWVRVRMKKTAGWDDWLMVVAMILTVGSTACSITGTRYGWGYHIWDFKPSWSRGSRLLSWINQLFYILVIGLVKVSLLCSYLRFSTTVWLPRFAWALIALNIGWAVAFIIALCLACKPLHLYWDGTTFTTHCYGEHSRLMSASIISIITDFLVLVLPMSTFWKLKLPIREKVVLFTLMSMGMIACVASIVRTYYIARTTRLTYDVPWNGYNIWVWTVVEINLAVICASIPTLRPFVRKYLPSLGFKRSSNQSRYTTQASDWPRSPSGIRMSHVSGSHRPPVRLHQVIPPVGPKTAVTRSESNSSGNSVDASKRWTDNSIYMA